MAKFENFWAFFDEVETALQHRCTSFRQMCEHLDKFGGPITIVETGCTRDANNWSGDGCSTVLFDKYVDAREDFVLVGAKSTFRKRPEPGGKGRLFAEYAKTFGANLEFSSYQAGWTGFNRTAA
jgi:hypothetical protein